MTKFPGYKYKKKKSRLRLLSINIAFIGVLLFNINSFIFVEANPKVPPKFFHGFVVGLHSQDLDMHHVSAQVQIDVYDTYSEGQGEYLIRNLQNRSIIAPIYFSAGHHNDVESGEDAWNEKISNFTVNGTHIEPKTILNEYAAIRDYSDSESIDFDSAGGVLYLYEIPFPPHSEQILQISWKTHTSVIKDYTHGTFYLTTEHRRIYYTGYAINGGKHWNNHSIEKETVVFHFHTSKFFVDSNQNIAVLFENPSITIASANYLSEWRSAMGSTTKYPTVISQGTIKFELEYSNIIDDIFINIINDHSWRTYPNWLYITWCIIAISFLGITIVVLKKSKDFLSDRR